MHIVHSFENSAVALQKFSSISFRQRADGLGRSRYKGKEIFWKVRHASFRACAEAPPQAERTQRYKATTRSARATSFVLEVGSNLVQFRHKKNDPLGYIFIVPEERLDRYSVSTPLRFV